MEKFLVTGGAGFIGSNICRRLVAEGCYVRVVDNLLTGKRSNLDDLIDKIDFVQADMGDPNVARSVMKGIDVVLHEGALPSVPRSVDEPELTHKHCVDATFTLLMAARDAGVKRFVYAASSSAYGDTPTLPKVETMPTSPLSPYAVGKLVGEYYCSVFAKVFGLETISLRYFNVFGPYQDPTSQYAAAIPAFVTSILKDQPPTIYGDGEQSRDFTYIDNVVHANLCAARAKKTNGEVVNIACGEKVTVNEIIALINEMVGKKVVPHYAPARAGDVKHSLADITAARKLIGFEPVILFRDGLQRAIAWYRDNLM
ncbi:MAG: SDR family oxidoreductase [Sedimentisphaerales bacterium]|jgi:nucleoside-diphosphate-sugar epimerase|nr:SDR family oxidoreductase [Sedimentisphaerales bacterium]HNY78077.1 SDR family oxidoreductase [Sedimentisphaerales bacterium]HOC63205.1 SDR family oxidoreductase [Sedimentisphaerales bacterium]HOH64252.1 SDR family oxidoreductase [Sedimentisphaerales bacterium]HPY49927.1 SDR family oxidoreductase [Sedimentisphaerales bacterium]